MQFYQRVFVFVALLGFCSGLSFCFAHADSSWPQSFSDSSIHTYLKNSHCVMMNLKEDQTVPQEIIHVVMGNQSADMDSIVSAIVYVHANLHQGFYVPLINIEKDELPLRADVLYVFEKLNINPDHILYQGDLPFLSTLAEQGHLRMTLVDHNRLAPDQEVFGEFVECIIDHHHEENIEYPLLDDSERLVSVTGSNATLVAEKILAANTGHMSSEMAYLLLSAILLDTGNLKKNGVTTEKDLTIAHLLIEKAHEYSTENLYDDLFRLKNTVSHLTPDLLLKKDYKLYKEGKLLYGVASISNEIRWTSDNFADWQGAFVRSLEKQKIHLLTALTSTEAGRVWIVYAATAKLQDALLSHIQHNAALQEVLILQSHFQEEGFLFFTLKNSLSRKQLQPIFSFEESDAMQNAIQEDSL